ncbi:phage terminase small subunit P27 family [Bradyrhizobium liaoningense]|uniref:phage terminase small subunit P27 family n=1 Tax=Bradyrhizobium liaoningense TaxID=43992 RepID=UPI001BA7C9AC|nr:phage terminase small subunit P27 family [Bradyrhizobium liaoningense]MBR0879125.1 phage terminase small subunit P27 family [Bradyrhizobium liaoningense]
MQRGPRPVPTHLKLLRGNPGKEKLNRDEPEPLVPPSCPEPPPFVTGYAAEEWRRIATELYRLHLLTVVDIGPLAAYCVAYGEWRTARETLDRIAKADPVMHGLLLKRDRVAVQNPLVYVARKAAQDMVRYASEFGLTPAARSRIATGLGETAGGKFADLLAG